MTVQISQDEQTGYFDQFSQASFDPVQFLNDTLPSLSLASQAAVNKQPRTATLQSTSTDVQACLSKLNTHSIRSSSELSSRTDDILRSGNRLAYEVEVLRGDVNGLYELLAESLKDDISRFVLKEVTQESTDSTEPANTDAEKLAGETEVATSLQDPEFIRQLRTLGTVKSRLEAVIHVFGEALKWPIPPSEVSMASLISVSAPELGVANTAEDDKAREYARKLRTEIVETLEMDGGSETGLHAAIRKVNDLRAISRVWKGTAEERARNRVVENLTRLVEERKKLLDARSASARLKADEPGPRSTSIPGRAGRIVEGSTNTAAGLFRNLQKFRDEIYQD